MLSYFIQPIVSICLNAKVAQPLLSSSEKSNKSNEDGDLQAKRLHELVFL